MSRVQPERIFMFRTNVNEMNVQSIDFGHELRDGVQLRTYANGQSKIIRACVGTGESHAAFQSQNPH